LVNRFSEEFSNSGKPVIVADDGERLQPMVVMLQKQLLPELQSALQAGERKPDRWYAAMGMAQVSFAADSLYNFNTHEQITPKS
jgi:molybdopterin-guanine dinucleotide biosynthesis protein A